MNSWQNVRDAVAVVVFVLLFAAVPATMIGLSIHEIIETRQWMDESVAASAVVEERHRHGGDDEWEATVLFSPVEGDEVSAKIVATELGETGSVANIRYDPEHTDSARLAPSTPFWLGPAFGILVGAIFLAFLLADLVAIPARAVRDRWRAGHDRVTEWGS